MQSGELCVEGSDQPFMFGGGEVDRVAIGGGGCMVLSGDPARASPSATSSREIFSSSARCAGSRLAQMDARCPRWGGGPLLMAREARGSGTVGRNPGVRPVLEPVVARRSVAAMGERSRSGPGAREGGEAILVVTLAEAPVLGLEDAVVGVVGEDMLRETRKQGARGEKSRGGATRTVKGGWLATRVVTRGAVAEVR